MQGNRLDTGFARLRLFAASLWLSLVTAIICAVLPVGAPLTTMLGSAFNPSTTHVAINAPAAQRATLLKQAGEDGRDAAASHQTLPRIQLAGIPVPLATADGGPSPAGSLATQSREQRTQTTAHPRAPPAV